MTPMEIIVARAPCYKPSANIYALINLAESQTSQTAYGTQRASAVALLTLHWLALQERGKGGAAGQVVSESEGDLSRSYAQPTAGTSSDGGLTSTAWGQELTRLRRSCFIGHRTRQAEC